MKYNTHKSKNKYRESKMRNKSLKKTKRVKKRSSSKNLRQQYYAELIIQFLQMLNTVKLYHWRTYSYATHEATDKLYTSLNDNVDKFVEVLLGKRGERVNLNTNNISLTDCATKQEFKNEIVRYKEFLVNLNNHYAFSDDMTNTDLFNIRDEILADLNQFLYLYTFK